MVLWDVNGIWGNGEMGVGEGRKGGGGEGKGVFRFFILSRSISVVSN